jgi:hypothetical protein
MRPRRRHSSRTARPGRWRFAAILVLGIVATLASGAVGQRAVARYADIDGCATGCEVAAAGWPLPYVVDYPGLSPANEASLVGLAMRVDRLRPEAFAVDLLAWTALAALVVLLLGRRRR